MHKKISVIVATLLTASAIGNANQIEKFDFNNKQILSEMKQSLNGKEYHFIKYFEGENTVGVVLDSNGNITEAPKKSIDKISKELQKEIKDKQVNLAQDEFVELKILLQDDFVLDSVPTTETTLFLDDSDRILVNGELLDKKGIDTDFEKRYDKVKQDIQKRKEYLEQYLPALALKLGIEDAGVIQGAIERGTTMVRHKMKYKDVESYVLKHDEIKKVEKYKVSKNEGVSARSVTGVDEAISNGYTGSGIGIYICESAFNDNKCPQDDFFSNAHYQRIDAGDETTTCTLPDCTPLNELEGGDHARAVVAVALETAPGADVYCKTKNQNPVDDNSLPTDTEILGTLGLAPIFVESHSWGEDPNGEYTADDEAFDTHVYNTKMTVFKSAGNDLAVTYPGNALNVITVGNYDESIDSVNITDSASLDINMNVLKPEIMAPGTNITFNSAYASQIYNGSAQTGTSLAAPFAAGFSAIIMDRWSGFKLRPQAVKSVMMVTADNQSGWDTNATGSGLINYPNFDSILYNRLLEGGNDLLNDDKDYHFTFEPGTTYKIAMAWLNKGNYIGDNNEIGMDIDLHIYKYNGTNYTYVTGSGNWNSGIEEVEFTTSSTLLEGPYGTHFVRVHRYSNNDASTNLELALFIAQK